jgi:glutamate 5-kinase
MGVPHRRVVVKVGTSTLTHDTGKLNLGRIERLVRELADLSNAGHDVVLVTSGAVGAGVGRLGWQRRPATIPEKQAVAAVGQGLLMQVYERFFSEYDIPVAQVLLTREDVADRRRYLNARNALFALLSYRVVPIINENDTIATEELRFGDNDTLSALVAGLLSADLLVLLSDVAGLYTGDPRRDPDARLIEQVDEISQEIEALAGGSGTVSGTGGMLTKLAAARVAVASGVNMVIACGEEPGALSRIVAGERIGTLFPGRQTPLDSRKRWIAFNRPAVGKVIVDNGAKKALVELGKSLLPAGVVAVQGEFEAGDLVSVVDERGSEFARGLTNFGSVDVEKLKRLSSGDVEQVLGSKLYEEVVHRDNLVVL